MDCLNTTLKDAKLIKPKIFRDDRGFFLETWRQNAFDDSLNGGSPLIFTQDNYSSSCEHVLRGLHFQFEKPQGKLVQVIHGAIYDVIVDLRQHSPTFGRWEGFHLTAENKHMLWVPPGFAHGFYTLEKRTDVSYKCTAYYQPGDEYTLMWDDADLNIKWPLLHTTPPIVSTKDLQGVSFRECPKYA